MSSPASPPPPQLQLARLASELQMPAAALAAGPLLANLHVGTLDAGTGALALPAGFTSAILEIGCSDFGTADEELLPRPEHADAFLLSFEPLLDKYAVLAARGTARYHNNTRDRSVSLGHHHRRGVVLPLAVSPMGGPVNFTVGHVAGCSSMLPVADARRAFTSWCGARREMRVVPSVSLETAIGLLGPDLPISVLKIDAQGVDFKLLKAAPRALVQRRVAMVQMETRSPTCPLLYEGQSTCDEVYEYMTSLGYAVRGPGRMRENRGCPPGLVAGTTTCSVGASLYNCCEQNVAYVRREGGRRGGEEQTGQPAPQHS